MNIRNERRYGDFVTNAVNETSPPISKHLSFRCLHELLAFHSERTPEALAICAPGRMPLTYGGLLRQVEDTVRSLNNLRVAVTIGLP